jgi:hypothetical protein
MNSQNKLQSNHTTKDETKNDETKKDETKQNEEHLNQDQSEQVISKQIVVNELILLQVHHPSYLLHVKYNDSYADIGSRFVDYNPVLSHTPHQEENNQDDFDSFHPLDQQRSHIDELPFISSSFVNQDNSQDMKEREELKRQYRERFGVAARGSYSQDINWLRRRLGNKDGLKRKDGVDFIVGVKRPRESITSSTSNSASKHYKRRHFLI